MMLITTLVVSFLVCCVLEVGQARFNNSQVTFSVEWTIHVQ